MYKNIIQYFKRLINTGTQYFIMFLVLSFFNLFVLQKIYLNLKRIQIYE